MAQRWGRKLQKRFGGLDIVCGPGQLPDLANMIEEAARGTAVCRLDPSFVDANRQAGDIDGLDQSREAVANAGASAFVRVMRGCNKFCTYCIVPYVRGPERSRDPGHIVDEVRKLTGAGRTEITLLGQTVNSYCRQTGDSTVRFSNLLARVADVPGVRRLRFVTSHPTDFGDDILEAMRDLPNVCEYIHCPAQSGSDTVLKRMKRGYTRAQYDDLIDRARTVVPGVVLAGDFIVGFSGETDEDHAASADLIRRSGYKNSFVFKYSPRPGTKAETNLPDDVPEQTKRRRNNELLAAAAEVGTEHHARYVGETLEVLVTGESPRADRQPQPPPPGQTQLTARTRWNHIVVFWGPEDLVGQYVRAKITRANNLTLFGERVEHLP